MVRDENKKISCDNQRGQMSADDRAAPVLTLIPAEEQAKLDYRLPKYKNRSADDEQLSDNSYYDSLFHPFMVLHVSNGCFSSDDMFPRCLFIYMHTGIGTERKPGRVTSIQDPLFNE